ncbi:hypothetical protein ATCM_03685 [Stenotrophomonas sp. ATCM1_4]|uniref:hypothetical protein n=1 Tax=Stenotrophomonas sp. ATCM1_4 TaxID=2259330 RepID=UPI00104D0F84|nr:hypothetical protein [Stenotrophomonas sp. ATCM1_4]TDB26819.1 hypothetical protein ATCM_03685 [Stenotrophomonas sp. ATCM1_4]
MSAAEAIDHIAIGHDLARKAGVNLDKARPRTRRMWEARGLAVIALARGDLAEAQKIMRPFNRNKSARAALEGEAA